MKKRKTGKRLNFLEISELIQIEIISDEFEKNLCEYIGGLFQDDLVLTVQYRDNKLVMSALGPEYSDFDNTDDHGRNYGDLFVRHDDFDDVIIDAFSSMQQEDDELDTNNAERFIKHLECLTETMKKKLSEWNGEEK